VTGSEYENFLQHYRWRGAKGIDWLGFFVSSEHSSEPIIESFYTCVHIQAATRKLSGNIRMIWCKNWFFEKHLSPVVIMAPDRLIFKKTSFVFMYLRAQFRCQTNRWTLPLLLLLCETWFNNDYKTAIGCSFIFDLTLTSSWPTVLCVFSQYSHCNIFTCQHKNIQYIMTTYVDSWQAAKTHQRYEK